MLPRLAINTVLENDCEPSHFLLLRRVASITFISLEIMSPPTHGERWAGFMFSISSNGGKKNY